MLISFLVCPSLCCSFHHTNYRVLSGRATAVRSQAAAGRQTAWDGRTTGWVTPKHRWGEKSSSWVTSCRMRTNINLIKAMVLVWTVTCFREMNWDELLLKCFARHVLSLEQEGCFRIGSFALFMLFKKKLHNLILHLLLLKRSFKLESEPLQMLLT